MLIRKIDNTDETKGWSEEKKYRKYAKSYTNF